MTRHPNTGSSRHASGARARRSAAAWIGCAALALLLTRFAATPAAGAQAGEARIRLDLAPRPVPVAHGADAARRELENSTGAGWDVDVDPISGVAARGTGGRPGAGAPVGANAAWEAADSFRMRHATLLGADRTHLERVRWVSTPRAWHATWQQMLHGRPVLGCHLDLLLAEDGDPVAFRSTLMPDLEVAPVTPDTERARRACQDLLAQPLAVETTREVVVLEARGGRYAGRAALQLVLRGRFGARWQACVEVARNRVVQLESLVRNEVLSGSTTGDVKPLYAREALARRDFGWVRIHLGEPEIAATWGDAAGGWRFTTAPGDVLVRARLEGRWVQVEHWADEPPSPGAARQAAIPGATTLHFGTAEARDDERTIYYHTVVVHDVFKERFGFDLLDFSMPAVASVRNPANGNPDYANAFWDGTRMAFGNGGGRYENFGLFADVVYHEYVHAVTDYIYRPVGGLPGALGGAIHEGRSDYFACTITDEPLLGEFVSGGPEPFRNLDNTLRWPQDRDPEDEEHANGEILAGAFWDVRMRTGAAVADALVHFAAFQYPLDFEAYLQAILVADDVIFGDGAPGNGSPHRDAVLGAFAEHGMGPLAGQPLRIRHVPLRDTEDEGVARRVVADVGWVLPDAVNRMELHWSSGGAWTIQVMQPDSTGAFSGEIPPQAAGTTVQYWLRATRSRPFEEYRLPENAPQSLFAYSVGPDTTSPLITHAHRARIPAFSWPGELSLRIDDNLGLAQAYVEHTLNGAPAATMGLARSPDDPTLYRARFPGIGGRLGDVVEYWITAVDASRAGNVRRLPELGAFRLELVANLDEGFEDGAPAWLHHPAVAGRPDPWHMTEAFNRTPGGAHAWWCGVDGQEYPTGTAAGLLTDWYAIGDAASASVWSWMDAEVNIPPFAFDGGIVEIQAEGDIGWEILAPQGGYTHTMSPTQGTNYLEPGSACFSGRDSAWRRLEFDLAAWAGERVRLRFLFASDGTAFTTPLRGWLLDDFFLDPGTRHPSDAPIAAAGARARLLASPPSPNPFNPSIAFELDVPDGAGRVRLQLFDTRGRRVATLLDRETTAGRLRIVWDGRDERRRAAPSGLYVYRLESRTNRESGKIVLLR